MTVLVVDRIPDYGLRIDLVKVGEAAGKVGRHIMKKRLIAGLQTTGDALPQPKRRKGGAPWISTGKFLKSIDFKVSLDDKGRLRCFVRPRGRRSRAIIAGLYKRGLQVLFFTSEETQRITRAMHDELARQHASGEFRIY